MECNLWDLLTPGNCGLLAIAAAGIGISKSGFAGISMLHVLIFAIVFGTKASTGILLPMLIIGDVMAILFFGKKAQWDQFRKLLPPTIVGVIVGAWVMKDLDESIFKPLVGFIILTLTIIQVIRIWRPKAFESLPHHSLFAWTLGLLAGITTMLANAAGPIVALYLLAVALPKLELVGTSAWFFLTINIIKLPFSYFVLDLISIESLAVDIAFAPAILGGMLFGRWLLKRMPQKAFDSFLLAFTGFMALRLISDAFVVSPETVPPEQSKPVPAKQVPASQRVAE